MMKRMSLGAAVLCTVIAGSWMTRAGDHPTAKPAASAPAAAHDMPPMPKPGPQHEWMRKLDGTWLALVQDHMMPGAKPEAGTMTCRNMGGFWELCDFTSEMMGTPFHGHEIKGYDTKKKKHTSIWVDSMGDYFMLGEGTASADGMTTTMWGRTTGMDGKMMTLKMVTSWTDNDHITFKMWTVKGKKETLQLEITYTRKK